MATTVTTKMRGGRQVIGPSDFVKCNTRYHKPYLAKVEPGTGDFEWQDKIRIGYGKQRETWYAVDGLEPGDLVQMAGGSGGNTYPFKGRVVSRTDTEITLEQIDYGDWSNLVAKKAFGKK